MPDIRLVELVEKVRQVESMKIVEAHSLKKLATAERQLQKARMEHNEIESELDNSIEKVDFLISVINQLIGSDDSHPGSLLTEAQ